MIDPHEIARIALEANTRRLCLLEGFLSQQGPIMGLLEGIRTPIEKDAIGKYLERQADNAMQEARDEYGALNAKELRQQKAAQPENELEAMMAGISGKRTKPSALNPGGAELFRKQGASHVWVHATDIAEHHAPKRDDKAADMIAKRAAELEAMFENHAAELEVVRARVEVLKAEATQADA